MSEEPPKISFKNAQYSYIEPGGKKHVFKSLKQILAVEKTQQLPEGTMSYSSFNAPPSLRPPKKYSDISGLIAPYTDPHSKLRYANSDEYAVVKTLPSDIVAGYLALRGASSIVG
ncbi:INO80 complex subunit C [Zeugodacus cucurbitae]|uniref:INO80 complex subunit C n=1 Tax=Zeugodacus cucurbitae TaxID=28588 RepID=UPI0005967DB6|nr:INO80 complex subunit C [Zeugodacus cucurbitae]